MVINKKQMVNTPCIQCGENIHPKRLEILPNTRTCVKCSNTSRKKGVNVLFGEGDHTYNDIVIMEESQYRNYLHSENTHRKTINGQAALDYLDNENTDPDYVAPEIDIAEETDNAS
jgi:hypothetical protein